MTTPDWAQKARDMTLANCSSDHCRAVGRGCGCYETNLAALREAYERGAADMKERAAVEAETKGYSEIDLLERMGPFTIQDKATESCSANIAAAIRALPAPAALEEKR